MSDVAVQKKNEQKRVAAKEAAALVEDGMIVGLGTGSTSAMMIEELGARWKQGLRFKGIPTSEKSAEQARSLGIELTEFAKHQVIDLAIDGADEVILPSLGLVKGLGGALFREKIVASAAKRFLVIVDESKIVDHLGSTAPIPVEITPFGWEVGALHLEEIGAISVKPRMDRNGIFRTDNGNIILDCNFGRIEEPYTLFSKIAKIVGVIESGLFLNMATELLVATEHGVDTYLSPSHQHH